MGPTHVWEVHDLNWRFLTQATSIVVGFLVDSVPPVDKLMGCATGSVYLAPDFLITRCMNWKEVEDWQGDSISSNIQESNKLTPSGVEKNQPGPASSS